MPQITTPFPAIPGSPTQKTDEKFYCLDCYCADYANVIERTGVIFCPECDSKNLITLEQHRREDLSQRDALLAEMDREADERYEAAARADREAA